MTLLFVCCFAGWKACVFRFNFKNDETVLFPAISAQTLCCFCLIKKAFHRQSCHQLQQFHQVLGRPSLEECS